MSSTRRDLNPIDPSEMACRTYNSFIESKPEYNPDLLPQPYISESPISLSLRVVAETLGDVNTLIPKYCDVEEYNRLQDLRHDIGSETEARNLADPFYKMGNSVFASRNAVKLSNMDAIYKFTGHYSSLLKPRLDQTYEQVGVTISPIYEKPVGLFKEDVKFTYCGVNDPLGAFVHYIQYRVKNGQGYGMNPIYPTSQSWNLQKLSTRYFTITNGEDGNGFLFYNWEYFIHMVRQNVQDGVHLTVANGEIAEDYDEETNKEYLNSRLLLEEALVGIGCSSAGGNFVMKIFDTVNQHSAELLYVLAQCFEAIVPFKPISSTPSDSERYLICLRRRTDDVVDIYKNLLAKVHSHYKQFDLTEDTVYVTRFLKDPLPESFVDWLTEQNNHTTDTQIQASLNVLDIMADRPLHLPIYNLPQTLKIWSIPDNIPKERDLLLFV